ncbi:MAG TPA: hypothetical protein PLL93_05820, partial [bacterium]|nr:hypothetical protein [bacterium]
FLIKSLATIVIIFSALQACSDDKENNIASIPNTKWKLYKQNKSLYEGEFYMQFTADTQKEWSYDDEGDCIDYEGETSYKVENGLLRSWNSEENTFDSGVEFSITNNTLYIDSILVGKQKIAVFAEYKYNDFDESKFNLCDIFKIKALCRRLTP